MSYELNWIQQPKENMYPYIKTEEQKVLYDIFHYENSYLSFTDKRKVRFCLKCKVYYKPNKVMKDVNINLCEKCFANLIN